MYTILIVEDDHIIAGEVERELTAWGYQASCVSDFQRVLADFAALSPHLIILDISLPFFNGYHWCQEIRRISKVPILFLSSAADNMNIVMAMQMGGDDFIAKPFDRSVLIAKVQALLRRTYDFGGKTDFLEHKGAILNRDDATLTFGGQTLTLTRNDYRILHTLLESKGKTVSRDSLMTRLWETDCYVDENTLTVNIARLRRKLEEIGLSDFIITKKGMGYMVE